MARRKKVIPKQTEGKSDKAIFLGVKFAQVPYSNFVGGKYIDRMYGTYQGVRLVQADGTEYSGNISTKQRRLKRMDGTTFMQTLHVTADGRWFDNSGMPMSKPEDLDEKDKDEQTSQDD